MKQFPILKKKNYNHINWKEITGIYYSDDQGSPEMGWRPTETNGILALAGWFDN